LKGGEKMDWTEIIKEALIIVLPPILAYIFGKWGIDQDKIAQHSRLLLIAKQAVLWAQDAFPDKPGVERYEQAYNAFIQALDKAGLLSKIPQDILDQILRAAYQETIGVKKLGN